VKYIKNFGKIIRICLANKWLKYYPFISYNSKFIPNSAIEKKEYFSILISNCVAVEKNKR